MSKQKELIKILKLIEEKYPLDDVVEGKFGDLIEDTILNADVSICCHGTCIVLSETEIFEYDHNSIDGKNYTRTLI